MIKVKGLVKYFEEFKVLNDLDMNVDKGRIYGLVGPNGSGKTTLINHLVGVYKKEKGSITIAGENVYENDQRKSRIAYMPDEVYFYNRFRVKDLKKFYKNMYHSFNDKRYDELAKVIKLDQNARVNKLSKGMRKQAFLHMLLSVEPELLILDEPFDGIDVIMRKKIRDIIIGEVADRNLTIVVSSHNLKELEDLCDTIGMIREGRILSERDLDDIKGKTCKVQVVFKEDVKKELYETFQVLAYERIGNVESYIIEEPREAIEEKMKRFTPLVLDFIPLTLEEVFIYEMEGYEDEE